jgi:hypothetical protein
VYVVPVYDERDGMHPADFRALLNRLDRIPFDSDKVNYLLSRRHDRFTSAQVRTLLDHLDYDSDRVRVACSLFYSVVDRRNWDLVFSALDYESSRDEVYRCSR